jgi:PrcB C-terminal
MSTTLKYEALVVLLISCLTGCLSDTNAETPIPTVPFSVIVSGDNPVSGVNKNRKLEVFRDQASLNTRLAEYVQFVQEHTVDFSTKRAVLLDLGQRDTGGYSVATSGIQEFSDHIVASITITKSGSNCAVTQTLTSPFQFIEVQSSKEILFVEQLVVSDCN